MEIGFADEDYLRRGKTMGMADHILDPKLDALIDARLSGMPLKEGIEIYANPAASSAMLADDAFDLAEWLVDEVADEFRRSGSFVRGPTRVLRDPFSNKPFIQFYATRGDAPSDTD